MKLFLEYLKGKRRAFLTGFIFVLIFSGSFYLYHLPIAAVIYPAVLCAGIGFAACIFDFLHVRREHETLQRIKTIADVVAETFPETEKIQENDYQEIIRLLKEEYDVCRMENERNYSKMTEYYTVWVHQIKTPIASMHLHLQNEDSPLSRQLMLDLHRIEQYVEMVLTFLRLNSESTDYVIKEYDLDKIIRQSVKKFSSEFIQSKLRLVYEPVNTTVTTDEKWLSFVIEQVLSNALKYTSSGSIRITMEKEKTLCISDTGIGIAKEDLPRIFENGYTGYNGRTERKASGIGLYLCREICKRLGHEITASSTVDEGTVIKIALTQIKLEIE